MPLQKFKTKKVYNNPGDSHFLTFSTKDKKPYLADERICRLLAGSISDAVRRHQYAVLAYGIYARPRAFARPSSSRVI